MTGFFYTTIQDDQLSIVRKQGLESVQIYSTLSEAKARSNAKVLVLRADRVEHNGKIPIDAILNLDPWLPPEEVTAAGGVLIRKGPEVLLIRRRGLWDLPKGKQSANESISDCAVRELKEELGVGQIELILPVGTTLHGYAEPQKHRYVIKTTHWYLARTDATSFVPEEREQIDRVEWFPYSEARTLVAYPSIRSLLYEIEPVIKMEFV